MLRISCHIIFFMVVGLLSQVSTAQVPQPNPQNAIVSIRGELDFIQSHLDSATKLVSFRRLTDSLRIVSWSDSLTAKVKAAFSPVMINRKLDSLSKLGAPQAKVNHIADSLGRKKDSLLAEVNSNQATLQNKISNRYKEWIFTFRRKFNMDSAGLKTPSPPNIQQPNLNGNIATGTLEGNTLPPSLEIPEIPELNNSDFEGLNMSPDLQKVGGDISIPSTDQLKGMDQNMKDVTGLLEEQKRYLSEIQTGIKDPGKVAESGLNQVSEVQQLNGQAAAIKENEALQVAEQLKSADLKEEMLPAAVNHFAGKEAVLKTASEKMAKYKEKYSSLTSLSAVKKPGPFTNGLKGVPFRDRVRWGVNFAVRSKTDTLLVDLFPNASYRISGRFEAGLGMMYRLRIKTNSFGFDQSQPVWGTNLFVVAKTFKSVFVRLEMDGTSYPVSATNDKPTYRDWRWSFLSGVQTNFRISRSCSGNVQMLYNFDSKLKDGFPERLSVRMGVQFRLRR